MTSNDNSNNFLNGMLIINKYKNDEYTINIVEGYIVEAGDLNRISKEDKEALVLLGWVAGNNKDGGSFAYFDKMEYVEC